ncbi:MAG: VanZ family protein [Lachnospiraceae bacterium]|nr:VanZ family protein [Lachnospiraceae bacterium]
MCGIFFFSSREAIESSQSSMTVSMYLVEAADQIGGWSLTPEQARHLAALIEGPIRKCAHVIEYTLLSCAVYIMFIPWFRDGIKRYFATLLVSILYAASDEIHQLFVNGRSGSFRDVCVDAVGVTAGAMFMLVLQHLKERKRHRTDCG